MRQNPSAFEFNEYLLLFLVDQVQGCRFGTFLYESEKERLEHNVAHKSPSIWTFVYLNKVHFINPFFQSIRAPLYINTRMTHLELWRSYYFRWRPSFLFSEPMYDRAAKVLWRAKSKIQDLERQIAELKAGRAPQGDS